MLKLLKSDIHRIRGAVYQNDDGNCVFVFYDDCNDYGVEYIILRNLLLLFGEQMRIVSEDEYIDENEELSIHLTTNLPWETFMRIDQEED